ncbi:MAG: pyridoxal-phosphate dependent enzyme [Betaproteobacteria bacterium]|jgi:cystathionine beta-synthase|nr:MAG: pyridoxal-phosphate dependent enzyme [Betaproteobacteria bacterium]
MSDVLSLIGNTPLVEVTRFDTGPCKLFLKLESQNPGGSIKDRIGLSMIEAAERDGKLKPGGTIVEATAGNTGLGLALVAARKGYRLVLVIPDKMSQEKVFHLKAFGAEVVMTRSDVGKGHADYYQDRAEKIAKETPGALYVNQFGNPANPHAHETTTGPEIWAQMNHNLDAVVCGVGSGGTITGLTRFFRKAAPSVAMVLADPAGSILADYLKTGKIGEAGSWLVEGIGEDFIPPVSDLSGVKEAFSITDAESFSVARELLAKESIFAGSSTGTLLAAALKYCRSRTKPERVVTFVCDSGNKYLSKMFNDYWLADQGFRERARHGDLRDLIGRPVEERATVSVEPEDTLLTAYGRFKLHDVSQLPVLEGEGIVGLIDEYDVLMAVTRGSSTFRDPVRKHMSTRLETLAPSASLDEVLRILDHGHVPIVAEGRRFHGLITRIDLLNSLRRKLP